jgi:transcription antitermination factor NusG
MAEPQIDRAIAVVFGNKAPMTLPAEWYAIQTRPRHEQVVAMQLTQDGIENLLPAMPEIHRWSDRRKLVHAPLFPTYVFVRVALSSNEERVRILRKTGVMSFVGPKRDATSIDPTQIENVRTLMNLRAEVSPYPYLSEGQRVRICSGAFAGLEGILVRKTDDRHLVVSIDLIHKSVSVCINGYDLEPA